MVAVRMSVTLGMLRSSAIWQSGSTLIMPLDKASRRLFETRSSRKSGTRLNASIEEFRPPASRRRHGATVVATSRAEQYRRLARESLENAQTFPLGKRRTVLLQKNGRLPS